MTAFQQFAEQRRWAPFPVTADHLLDFLAHASTRVSLATVRVYLQGLRHRHVVQAWPLAPFLDPRVGLILQGIARSQPTLPAARVRNPATPDDLRRVHHYLRHSGAPVSDQAMLWSAVTLAYYGFLRVSEYAGAAHRRALVMERVKVHSDSIQVALPYDKTCQLGEGGSVVVGTTGDDTCPVKAMTAYVTTRGVRPGILFTYQDGRTLRPADINLLLKTALPGRAISSHSLRIGAATTAGKNGIPDYLIQSAGRWRSSAYLRYVRLDACDLKPLARSISH